MAAEEKQVAEETVMFPRKMEFRLINPTEGGFLKHIEWNKAELEAAVRAKVAEYTGVVYTEDTVKAAKNDRAELNNFLKAIEDRRKKVKEIINQPYAEFEAELKEITALIKEQSEEIDKQVKAFEEAEKKKKNMKLFQAYEEAIGDLKEVLPYAKVFEQRYLNKTCKRETAISEIQNKIQRVKTDLESIESMGGKFKMNVKDVYVRTLDLSKAMAEEKRLTELEAKLEADRIQKEKAAEEKRKAEEARKAEAERIRKEGEQRELERRKAEEERIVAVKSAEESQDMPEAPQTILPEPASDPFAPQPVQEKKCRAKFYAIGTKEQLKALVGYMKENGIKYGKVE